MNVKRFFSVVLVSLILLIAGCSNLVDKGNEDTDSEFPPTMSGIVIINGKEYQMDEGNYRWERKKGLNTEVVQTDHASLFQMGDSVGIPSGLPS